MDNINLKSQIGAGTQFKQTTKNGLQKNMVSSFENKDAAMNLNQESEKQKILKLKKKEVVKKSSSKNDENKTDKDENKNVSITKLMNII